MICNNKVEFYVPRGYDYKRVEVKCGNTDPFGERAICDNCANNPNEMRSIERHEESIASDNAWLRSAKWGES